MIYYYKEKENKQIYTGREFGRPETQKDFYSFDLNTHVASKLTSLDEFDDDTLIKLHHLCAQNYEANKELTSEVESEMLYRKHIIKYSVPVLKCRNNTWSYEGATEVVDVEVPTKLFGRDAQYDRWINGEKLWN